MVLANPAGIVGAGIDQMWRNQSIDMRLCYFPGAWRKRYALKYAGTRWIGDDFLGDDEAIIARRIGDVEGRNATIDGLGNRDTVTLFFGEEATLAGDNQAEIARAGAIDRWVVDFIQNPVAMGEPHGRTRIECPANAYLGT